MIDRRYAVLVLSKTTPNIFALLNALLIEYRFTFFQFFQGPDLVGRAVGLLLVGQGLRGH
jgi:hypothetical protein